MPKSYTKGRSDPLVGRQIGDLQVLERLPDLTKGSPNTRARVMCHCHACGKRSVQVRYYLVRKPNPKTHCGCKVGASLTQKYKIEYNSYSMMLQRCYNVKHVSYKDYGGRGIRVSTDWQTNFENFLRDMGPKPSPHHSLDRIDPNGNYEKNNCRWATPAEQAVNQRRHYGRPTPI